MSTLHFPRIYFKGEASWDPGLLNNNTEVYDAETVQIILPPGITYNTFHAHVISDLANLGVWNLYGTHDARFENVKMTGAATGPRVNQYPDDPLIGKLIEMNGKLVDLDSATVNNSQIFLDQMKIGDDTTGIVGNLPVRMHSRWINFFRNATQLPIAGIAAASWQTTLLKDGLVFNGLGNSQLLKQLRDLMDQDNVAGLMIRFQSYRTLYFQNGLRNAITPQPRSVADLIQLYTAGHNFSNPAYSSVVGVVGLALKEEANTMPAGRSMSPAQPVFIAKRRNRQGVIVDVPSTLAPVVFQFNDLNSVLSIDLGASTPERDINLEKVDLGTLKVYVSNGSARVMLAEIPYDNYRMSAYEQSAGIIDIDLTNKADIIPLVQTGLLEIECTGFDSTEKTALAEQEFFITADERDIYLDEDDTRSVNLKVSRNGIALAGVKVLVSSFDRGGNLISPAIETLQSGAGGVITFGLMAASAPGFTVYQFIPFSDAPPQPPAELDQMSDCFICTRTLPFDDEFEKSVKDEELTYDFVFQNILRVYHLLNPIMSRSNNPAINIPLDDRARIVSMATSIKRAVSRTTWSSVKYMPVTRALSRGKRKLLIRWCDLVLDGVDTAISTAKFTGAVNSSKFIADMKTISKDMRTL